MELDIINKKLNLKYYKSILSNLQKNDNNYDWLEKHCDTLLENLNNERDKLSDTITEKIEKKNESYSPNESENHKQIFSDDNLYKKSWTKLNTVHKILKIKEFVNNLKINSEKERAQLRDDLIDLIKLKVLTKKEKVNYDEVNGKIISLSNLQYKSDKYYYQNE